MDPPVNFANLSTGENGDSEAEFVASNPDHGGSGWTPLMRFSKRRLQPKQVVAKCLGYVVGRKALVSTKTPVQARPTGRWLPTLDDFRTLAANDFRLTGTI
jgi:hypothetical protein